MVIVITAPILFGLCVALAVPYVLIGWRSLHQAAREIPERHGLRDLEER